MSGFLVKPDEKPGLRLELAFRNEAQVYTYYHEIIRHLNAERLHGKRTRYLFHLRLQPP